MYSHTSFQKISFPNDDEIYDGECYLVLIGKALKYPEIEVNIEFKITVHKMGSA
jgi:hypothetical protein